MSEEYELNFDWELHKKRVNIYEPEAKERLIKVLKDNGYRIVGDWKDGLMFDFLIPGGHLEFYVKISGWGQSLEEREAGA